MTYQEPTNYNKHFDVSISPFSSADSDLISRVTVDSDGGPTQGRSVMLVNGVWIKALAGNSGNVYMNCDSTDDSDTGFELAAGKILPFQVLNLSYIWVKGAAGDGVCWLKI